MSPEYSTIIFSPVILSHAPLCHALRCQGHAHLSASCNGGSEGAHPTRGRWRAWSEGIRRGPSWRASAWWPRETVSAPPGCTRTGPPPAPRAPATLWVDKPRSAAKTSHFLSSSTCACRRHGCHLSARASATSDRMWSESHAATACSRSRWSKAALLHAAGALAPGSPRGSAPAC